MKREILVPLDGSELAARVLPHAVALARATFCGIVLLRVVESPAWLIPISYGRSYSQPLTESLTARIELAGNYLNSVAEPLRSEGLAVRTEVVRGEPASVITTYAQECPGITAIAMSTHGRSGLKRWLLGSVAEKVLHTTTDPLLLVRSFEAEGLAQAGEEEGGTSTVNGAGKLPGVASSEANSLPEREEVDASLERPRFRTVLVPLDGSACAEEALLEARAIAIGTEAKLKLLSVVPTPSTWVVVGDGLVAEWIQEDVEMKAKCLDHYLAQLADKLTLQGLRVETTRASGDAAEEILHASLSGIDLIVMSTHGRSGWHRMWEGSVATKVLRHSSVPVLLIRVRKPVSFLAPDHATMPEFNPEANEIGDIKEGTLHTADWFGRRY